MKHRNESRLDASAVASWIGVALVQLVWATSSGGISTAQSLSFSRSLASGPPNDGRLVTTADVLADGCDLMDD